MKLSIDYKADYHYEAEASLSPHIARVLPRTDLFVKVHHRAFTTHPTGDIQYRRDLFDNLIAYCFYPEPIRELPFRMELEIEVGERNPFHFLLDSRGLHIPCDYTPSERAVLDVFLKPSGSALALPAPLASTGKRPTVETLVTMNLWIHENIAYERREEGEAFSPEETLRRESGACRDVAVLFAEVLRRNGVAARLASGFVWEGDKEEGERRAESAMHAWVEACLPGAGWIGMDPTNGVFCDHHFITTAVGFEPADVSPVSGTYYGRTKIESHLTTALDIRKI